MTASIIGSCKQFYNDISKIRDELVKNNIEVKSPLGNSILEEEIEFVRFDIDEKTHSDELVQSVTLERIFASNAVDVFSPNG